MEEQSIDLTVQQLEDYLKPFADASEQCFYYGSAFMNTWEELHGGSSLGEALNQSRMRKIAIVLASHTNRRPLLPAHCIQEQVRLEECLEKHNGYEIILVGNRTKKEPHELLGEHFDKALEIVHEAISHPGDQGSVIGLMVWIKGHGEEVKKQGLVGVDGEFKEIEIVQQMLQTDDGEFVNVSDFVEKLAEFAKENRRMSNQPFPIIVTKDLCRIHDDGGGRNYMNETSLDVAEIDAASSGEKAVDQHFVDQWCNKYMHDFKEQILELAATEVANIVSTLNNQRPQLKSNLDPNYKCIDGIYVDYF